MTGRDVVLVDTSAAIPLMVADHPDHESTLRALRGRSLGLAGHAAFETHSVLTRLPGAVRRTPAEAATMLRMTFPATAFLSADEQGAVAEQLGTMGIAGGQVYDALVGAVAAARGVPLVSRDERALGTYRRMGVEAEILP